MTTSFRGRIGTTYQDSEPHWDDSPSSTDAPNVVVILLDDTGFGNLGCYGSTIDTPHMDALAENGLRYNNFHVTPLCSPTRASILTGRNHHAVGLGDRGEHGVDVEGTNGAEIDHFDGLAVFGGDLFGGGQRVQHTTATPHNKRSF